MKKKTIDSFIEMLENMFSDKTPSKEEGDSKGENAQKDEGSDYEENNTTPEEHEALKAKVERIRALANELGLDYVMEVRDVKAGIVATTVNLDNKRKDQSSMAAVGDMMGRLVTDITRVYPPLRLFLRMELGSSSRLNIIPVKLWIDKDKDGKEQ